MATEGETSKSKDCYNGIAAMEWRKSAKKVKIKVLKGGGIYDFVRKLLYL